MTIRILKIILLLKIKSMMLNHEVNELRIPWLSIVFLEAMSAHASKSSVVIFKYFGFIVFNLQVLVQLLTLNA